jgi:ribokinase
MKTTPDVIAVGTCYVDINASNFPFPGTGIPVETELIGGDYEKVPGGSAVNFCRLLGKLGLETAFIGMAGEDLDGNDLELLLEQFGIQAELIHRPELQTSLGFNLTNPQGEHIMQVVGTAHNALHPDFVIPKLEQTLAGAKLLYLGGCFKLKAFAGAFGEVVRLAQKHSAGLVVDHGRIPDDVSDEMLSAVSELAKGAAYYFPSRDEFCRLWNVASIEDGLRLLHEQSPKLTVVTKDGSNGAYYWANDAVQHTKAEKVDNVVDVTGAGDSFNAGVMAAILQELPLSDAVTYGCRVAGAKVAGRAIPSLSAGTL